MTLTIPNNFKLCLTQKQIEEGTSRVAKEVCAWFESLPEDKQDSFVAVCVLRGGIFFSSDLLRKLNFNLQIEFVKISTYDETTNTAKSKVTLEDVKIDFDLKNKTVLVIDDICESGRTLRLVSEKFLAEGAREVKSAVLIKRKDSKPEFREDFSACQVDHLDYLVGMGFDDKKMFRHLPDIYKITN